MMGVQVCTEKPGVAYVPVGTTFNNPDISDKLPREVQQKVIYSKGDDPREIIDYRCFAEQCKEQSKLRYADRIFDEEIRLWIESMN